MQIVREAFDNRPLSLKNADNKICASVVNRCISPVVEHGTHKTQNGFVHGRQLLQNVVDLDAYARLFSVLAATHIYVYIYIYICIYIYIERERERYIHIDTSMFLSIANYQY